MNNHGGAAFPTLGREVTDMTGAVVSSGMTLRDYFAGQALALLGGRSWDKSGKDHDLISVWANSAYAIADAMLKARDRS